MGTDLLLALFIFFSSFNLLFFFISEGKGVAYRGYGGYARLGMSG